MLGTFLDKAEELLDRRFLIGSWFPVFVVSAAVVLIIVYFYGWEKAIDWWQQDLMTKSQSNVFVAQLWITVLALIAITVVAYLLQPFNQLIMKLYEGFYWKPTALRMLLTSLQKRKWEAIVQQQKCVLKGIYQGGYKTGEDWQLYTQIQNQLFYHFPPEEDLIMPTTLGNVLTAAEYYSMTAYGMDSFWWERLLPLLPDAVRKGIDDSLIPIVAFLNFSWLTAFVAISGSVYLMLEGFGLKAFLVLLISGLFLAWISYKAAIVQAKYSYGVKIRSAIDLYRFDLLKTLRQQLPGNLDEEIKLWDSLLQWVYFGNRGQVANMIYKN